MSSIISVDILKTFAYVAAPAGIAIGAFLLVMRDVIAKNIYPRLTKQTAYRVVLFVVFAAWSVALAGIVAWVYVSKLDVTQPMQVVRHPLLTTRSLQNLTYTIGDDFITLNEGRREFNPPSVSGIHENAIFAYLTDHAFGDLDNDGDSDAVAVLQVTDGGTGIYYYLAPVLNVDGNPLPIGPAYRLGDRLEFRSISVNARKVTAQLMMHRPEDGLCCPTEFRSLEFSFKGAALECKTAPCSEI